jgi:hypothetical protein
MSIMPPIQSHPPRSRQLSRRFPNATAATTLKKAIRLMAEWHDDLAYGEY